MACLVCLLLLAVILDLRSYKISNHLILIGIVAGILFDIYEYGQAGISLGLPGILLPVILLFPLFLIKALGAGDIKLFSVIGSFYGAAYVIKSIAAAFILGAAMSLIYLIKYKIVFYRFRLLSNYIRTSITNFTNHCTTMDTSGEVTDKGPRELPKDSVREHSEENKKGRLPEPYYDRDRDGSQGVIHFSIAVTGAVLLQIIYPYL